MTFPVFLQTIVIGCASGMINYLIVSGVALMVCGMGVVNMGQGAFYVLACFITYTLLERCNFWVACVLVILIVGALGILMDLLTRRLVGQDLLFTMLLTYGISYIVIELTYMKWGVKNFAHTYPSYLQGVLKIGDSIRLPKYYLMVCVVGLLVFILFWLLMDKTKLGALLRATITDRTQITCMGYNVKFLFMLMFILAMAMCGLAGFLNAPIQVMSTRAGTTIFANIMPIIFIGGLFNMKGALPAALLVGLVNAFGAIYFPQIYTLIPALIMVIVMLTKPDGILSKRKGA